MEENKMTRLVADLAVIQKLEDEPNDVGGMSAADLKAAFDQSGLSIQTFINEVLIPELEASGVLQILRRGTDSAAWLRMRDDRVIEMSEDGVTWVAALGPEGTTYDAHRGRHAKGGSDPIYPADIGAAVTMTYTAKVTTNWQEDGDYFAQEIKVTGIKAADEPIVDINPGSDEAANELYNEAFGEVIHISVYAGSILVWAKRATSISFPIRLKVVR